MIGPFVDYSIFVFAAAVGVIQVAAALNGLRGLCFIPHLKASGVAGAGLTVAAYLWYILSAPRNLPDTAGGLSGNQAAWVFSASVAAALAFSLVGTSVVHWRSAPADAGGAPGIDALRRTTFARAILSTVRRVWDRS